MKAKVAEEEKKADNYKELPSDPPDSETSCRFAFEHHKPAFYISLKIELFQPHAYLQSDRFGIK